MLYLTLERSGMLKTLTVDECAHQMKLKLSEGVRQCQQAKIKKCLQECDTLCDLLQKQYTKEKEQLVDRIHTLEKDLEKNSQPQGS